MKQIDKSDEYIRRDSVTLLGHEVSADDIVFKVKLLKEQILPLGVASVGSNREHDNIITVTEDRTLIRYAVTDRPFIYPTRAMADEVLETYRAEKNQPKMKLVLDIPASLVTKLDAMGGMSRSNKIIELIRSL